jgi:hypothetical protein
VEGLAVTQKKLSRAEALLERARRNPSPTCRDARQLDLLDIVKSRAFADLDVSIEQAMARSGRENNH